jgi:hypothetical protein
MQWQPQTGPGSSQGAWQYYLSAVHSISDGRSCMPAPVDVAWWAAMWAVWAPVSIFL